MNYYINPDEQTLNRLNDIWYFYYVTRDGVNFIPPFQAGTENYIAYGNTILVNDEVMRASVDNVEIPLDDREFIQDQLDQAVDEQTAINNGWIINPYVG